MKKPDVVPLLAVALAGVASWRMLASAAAEGGAADRSAILRVLDDEGAGWAAGDADAFAAHVLPEVTFANTVGMFSVGKASFVAQHRAIFATIYQGSLMRQFLVKLTFVTPDVAVVHTIALLSGFGQLPPGVEPVDGALYTRIEQVMVKRKRRWAVAAFHNVPIQPKFVAEEVRAITSGKAH